MARDTGFFQLRRGIWEHVRDGRMSLQDVAVHQYIASQADTRTGIWNGSAGALGGELSISPRMARRFIERLTKGDYIRRFPIPGRHVCYPILVHKFLITDGEHRGEQLNALASTSPVDLRYFPSEHRGEHQGEHVSPQKRIENREKRIKKNPAAKNTPPADPRFQPFVDFAYRSFETKHGGQRPSWQGKDYKALKELLASNGSVTPAELERRWEHYMASTEDYTAKKGDSLAHFCQNFDSFISGPLHGPRKEKPNASEIARINARNLGIVQ